MAELEALPMEMSTFLGNSVGKELDLSWNVNKECILHVGTGFFLDPQERVQNIFRLSHLRSVSHHSCFGSLWRGGVYFLSLQIGPVGRLLSYSTEMPRHQVGRSGMHVLHNCSKRALKGPRSSRRPYWMWQQRVDVDVKRLMKGDQLRS